MQNEPLPGASTALTMGIISIVSFFLCCGPFAAVFSIIGLVKAKSAERLYLENPNNYTDYSNVKTGKVLSWIGLILSIIGILITIIYFGAIIAFIVNQDDFGTY